MAASYVSVPRDLTKVKSKVIFNLTKRQIICFSVAALIGVPSFFLIKSVAEINVAVMGMMVVMMPIFFFDMYENVCCIIKIYKVAKQKRTMLHVQNGQNCIIAS